MIPGVTVDSLPWQLLQSSLGIFFEYYGMKDSSYNVRLLASKIKVVRLSGTVLCSTSS